MNRILKNLIKSHRENCSIEGAIRNALQAAMPNCEVVLIDLSEPWPEIVIEENKKQYSLKFQNQQD